jgi:hypothetical protein
VRLHKSLSASRTVRLFHSMPVMTRISLAGIAILAAACNSMNDDNSILTRQSATSSAGGSDQISKSPESKSPNAIPPGTGGGSSGGKKCEYAPVVGSNPPTQLWAWNDPSGRIYKSPPIVGDLDKDAQPEVVVIGALYNSQYADPAVMSVLDAKTGALKWQATNVQPLARTAPALFDLNADGYPEIILTEGAGAPFTDTVLATNVVALDARSRNVLWRTAVRRCNLWCMVSVADLDGDGTPEIVAGDSILTSTGQLKNTLAQSTEMAPALADLVPERPGLEIVADDLTVMSSTGQRLFDFGCKQFTSGTNLVRFSVIADLDRDKNPDLICISSGRVALYSNTGVVKWDKGIPSGGGRRLSVPPYDESAQDQMPNQGSAPTIADFNGDGFLEIGVASGAAYTVFSRDGQELWKHSTQDTFGTSSSSSAFDFNGDGKSEIIFNDRNHLKIFEGASGKILWETENVGGRALNYPVVANLDDTPSAELIVTTFSNGQGGIRAFRDPTNSWKSSRKMWNQFNYYPQLLSDLFAPVRVPGIPSDGIRFNSQTETRTDCVK